MSIEDAISEALANASPPPVNEAETCQFVIVPLLQACGYSLREIGPQQTDSYGKCPDYILLGGSPHTWYLEAKSWDEKLDKHEPQLIQYSATTGLRWGVLTNGKEWRLYDTSLKGVARERLIVSANIHDLPASSGLFSALGKLSVTTNGLAQYAVSIRLASVLRAELANQNSATIRRLCKHLQTYAGMESLKTSDVTTFFCGAGLAKDRSRGSTGASSTTSTKASSDGKESGDVPEVSSFTIGQLLANPRNTVTGRKPAAVHLPDDTVANTDSWMGVAIQIVRWLGASNQLPPLPYAGATRGKGYFLNSSPIDAESNSMRAPRPIHLGNTTIFMEAHRSALDCIIRIEALCSDVGVSPASFSVAVRTTGK